MTSELIDYVGRYGGNCRDCADNDGVCDRGTPCDPKVFRAAIEHTIKALEYGIKHGFIENPFTRAIPDVPELVRYEPNKKTYPYFKMEEIELGEYVLHSQAAAIIAAERAEKEKLILASNDMFKTAVVWQERAKAAEAKLAQMEKQS